MSESGMVSTDEVVGVSDSDVLERVSCRAYPQRVLNATGNTLVGYGLTKRELFAAMAMQAVRSVNPGCNSYEIAQSAVADADALLKELAK